MTDTNEQSRKQILQWLDEERDKIVELLVPRQRQWNTIC